jgi:hypothetical protein
MPKEIRTPRRKLVGTHNERTSILTIRDGKKSMRFKLPPPGLPLIHTFSDGVTEDIHIVHCGKPNTP